MAVIPELDKIKDELNRWLAPKFGDKLVIEFDYTAIPEMQEETEKVVDQLSKAWWITPNEKREVMNYGVDEENLQLNDYFIPSNLVPLNFSDIPVEEPKSVEIDYNFTSLKSQTTKQESFDDYPQGATNNARRMLEWREKYGRDVVDAGTPTGWQRANQLANREAISLDTVKRINSFLARHKDNAKIDPQYKNEPWKDRGYVAYNLWGGEAMVSWANRVAENG